MYFYNKKIVMTCLLFVLLYFNQSYADLYLYNDLPNDLTDVQILVKTIDDDYVSGRCEEFIKRSVPLLHAGEHPVLSITEWGTHRFIGRRIEVSITALQPIENDIYRKLTFYSQHQAPGNLHDGFRRSKLHIYVTTVLGTDKEFDLNVSFFQY